MLNASDESSGSLALGQQIVKRDPKSFFGIPSKVLLHEGGRESVKTGSHRCVGGEEVTRSCYRQRDFEGLPGLLHEVMCTFQHGKRRVPSLR